MFDMDTRYLWVNASLAVVVVGLGALSRTLRCVVRLLVLRAFGVRLPGDRAVLNRAAPDRVAHGKHPPVAAAGAPITAVEAVAALEMSARAVLSRFVDAGGAVNWAGLRGSAELAALASSASRLKDVELSGLQESELKAFWLNLYNALHMHAQVALAPANLVQKLHMFQSASYLVAGAVLSLDDIENGVLRGNRRPPASAFALFGAGDPRCALSFRNVDPRIHAALNCGAKSCPAVAVYSGVSLERDLSAAVEAFTSQNVRVVPAKGAKPATVHLSPIFLWYRSDFETRARGRAMHNADVKLLRGILPLLPLTSPVAKELHRVVRAAEDDASAAVRLVRAPYDWTLNAQ